MDPLSKTSPQRTRNGELQLHYAWNALRGSTTRETLLGKDFGFGNSKLIYRHSTVDETPVLFSIRG